MTRISDETEWLEADGAGGFASGTASGVRTRRYHALLLAATTPPTGRMVLVNGFDAWITTASGRWALSTQRYAPGVLHPDGATRVRSFTTEPWPTWTFALPDGVTVAQELFVAPDTRTTVLSWRVAGTSAPVTLEVRPFLSGRDYHALHHENPAFQFDAEHRDGAVLWRPYDGVPAVCARANGQYTHAPEWYRNFLYSVERERGLDDSEDLASPGVFAWVLCDREDEAVLMLAAAAESAADPGNDARDAARTLRRGERTRRQAFATPLARAADAYIVRRGTGRTIVAGYPWFTDWGRDTFIALRGLCLATGRLDDARDILLEWSDAVSEGMLPNRFPDSGELPEFNAVDASLWYVIAVHDFLAAMRDQRGLTPGDRGRLVEAVQRIVGGYAAGTRYGIRADGNGLLAAGAPGLQLTWMDARVGDRVITPRIGKPVEVQALWLNALWIAGRDNAKWIDVFDRGRRTFADRFWNPARSCLYDVIDVDHAAGAVDATIRPNQILAIGGLPLPMIEGPRARAIVDVVERELLTPYGLRSLARGEPGYTPRYEGGPAERDAAYHQGTVWPWLLGPFVDAWVRVRGGNAPARRDAHQRFIAPLLGAAIHRGGGHLCEITDAEAPYRPRGCPFQAWSLGELLRVERALRACDLTPPTPPQRVPAAAR